MKKENFVKMICGIIEQNKKEHNFCNALEPFFDGWLVPLITSDLTNGIIDVLESEMEDEYETISWWLYDAPDAGKCEDSCYIILKDDSKVRLDTVEQLYDYLFSNKSGVYDK